MNTPRDILIYYSLISHGDLDKTLTLIRSHDPLPDAAEISRLVAPYRKRAVTVVDPEYPEWLSKIVRAPFVFFYKGDLSLLENPDRIVAITGSQHPEDVYPLTKTREIAAEITEAGAVVLSGLSSGIQHVALESALSKGPAIAVLTHGFNRVYPAESKGLQAAVAAKGLALTIYGDDEPPSPAKMRERNCFLGQAGKFLFVASCRPQDGILISVALALKEGRDVGTLPCRAGEELINNGFIRDGAAVIENSSDLLFEMGLRDGGTRDGR